MNHFALFCTVFFLNFAFSQSDKNILKINYSLLPISQYYFNHDASTPQEEKDFDIALRTGYNYNYSLYYNLKEKKSLFVLDTLIVTKVKGKEDYWTDPENKINFCIIQKDGYYKRKEQIFDQEIYITGKDNIEWEILNDTKEIMGYKCYKAISKNKDLMFTVWFTKEIPVQTGPSLYNNLPGLVLWAEDYFSTISVTKISYEKNYSNYTKSESTIKNELKNIKQNDFTEETVFLLKKTNLVSQFKK
ncbi:GLPGLI family protein [Flavobacterium soli]|uniref:GLPGLI family protein n=1 Tax=Flavobacterium soli TaxID=344881 RepID=UPI000411C037|nr:GLPGLI family protein [Flavobacterium soli]